MNSPNLEKICVNHPQEKGVAFCKRCNVYICQYCIILVGEKKWCRKCYEDFKKQSIQSTQTCINHPNRVANRYCKKCDGYLCQECMIFRDGKQYCKKCSEYHQSVLLKTQAQKVPEITPQSSSATANNSRQGKKCPYCAERIQAEAIKCRYCGKRFDGKLDNEGITSTTSIAVGHKKCPVCGKIISDNDGRCPSCNTPRSSVADNSHQQNQSKQSTSVKANSAHQQKILFFIFVAVFSLIFIYIYFGGESVRSEYDGSVAQVSESIKKYLSDSESVIFGSWTSLDKSINKENADYQYAVGVAYCIINERNGEHKNYNIIYILSKRGKITCTLDANKQSCIEFLKNKGFLGGM